MERVSQGGWHCTCHCSEHFKDGYLVRSVCIVVYVWFFLWYDYAVLGRVVTSRGSHISNACLWTILTLLARWRKWVAKQKCMGWCFTDLSVNLLILQVKDSFIHFCQIPSTNSDSNLEVKLETSSYSSPVVIAVLGSSCPCANLLAFSWTVGFL